MRVHPLLILTVAGGGCVLASVQPAAAAEPTTTPAATRPTPADRSTLAAAMDAFTDAAGRNDPAGMAAFFFAQGAPDGRLALANARRILSATAFERAVNQRVKEFGGRDLARNFGLVNDDLDDPKMYRVQEHGDVAIATVPGPDEQAEWFKKVGGVWQQDITPPPPFTVAGRAQDMEDDSAAVDRVTAAVERGTIKTLPQVRDALGGAMLNARPDPQFSRDMRVDGEPQPTGHDRPDPPGRFPTDPTTPAGAMNRFVRAVEHADVAALRDSMYVPEDKDGTARAAAAHDLVVGMRLLRAAESRFSKEEDSDRVCYWLGVLGRYALRDYTDDEWSVETNYPDLAMGSGADILKTVTSNGQQVLVHESGWVPLMHRCPDGVWRTGPRFPQNGRQVRFKAAALPKRDAILDKAIIDLRAGKFPTAAEAINGIMPGLEQLGATPGLAGFPN